MPLLEQIKSTASSPNMTWFH